MDFFISHAIYMPGPGLIEWCVRMWSKEVYFST